MTITCRIDGGLITVEPSAPLTGADFQLLAGELRKARERGEKLRGLLILTKEFPGYENPSDILAHASFIREHHDEVRKVALCTESATGPALELLGKLFLSAEVRSFSTADTHVAQRWILD